MTKRAAHAKSKMCRWRHFGRNEDGSAAIEFALIAGPLFMLLFGIIEISRAYWIQGALAYSVEQAARCASIDSVACGTATQIKAFAANRSGVQFDTAIFTSSNDVCGRLVTASYPFTFHIPYFASSLSLTARACYPA
jgi:Flp pilus assembly protein TadG